MRREKTKKLNWTKPYLASFGDISEMTMGACNIGSANLSCGLGNMAINTCEAGNDAVNLCNTGSTAISLCNTGNSPSSACGGGNQT